jgi:hypothetical protein
MCIGYANSVYRHISHRFGFARHKPIPDRIWATGLDCSESIIPHIGLDYASG